MIIKQHILRYTVAMTSDMLMTTNINNFISNEFWLNADTKRRRSILSHSQRVHFLARDRTGFLESHRRT